jgi:hypothetical protein
VICKSTSIRPARTAQPQPERGRAVDDQPSDFFRRQISHHCHRPGPVLHARPCRAREPDRALDGANIEIMEEVGADNIFIFGFNTQEVAALKSAGYNPWDHYQANADLKRALDMYFSPEQSDLFRPVADKLTHGVRQLPVAGRLCRLHRRAGKCGNAIQ